MFVPESVYEGMLIQCYETEELPVYYAYGRGAPKIGRLMIYVYENELAIVARGTTPAGHELVSWVVCTTCLELFYSCSCRNFCGNPQGWEIVGRGEGRGGSRVILLNRKECLELQSNIVTVGDPLPKAIKLMEDVGALMYQWQVARSTDDIVVAIGSFVRSITGKSVAIMVQQMSVMVVTEFAPLFMRQSSSGWGDDVERLWSNYKAMRHSPFGDKFLKVFNNVVATSLFVKMGLYEPTRLAKLEEEKLRPRMKDCVSFFDAVGDLFVYILKQGRMYMITGDIDCFFVDGEGVSSWIEKSKRVKANFEFLNNPEPIRLDVFEYLKDLRTVIADGNGMLKSMVRDSVERRITCGAVIELETLEKRYLSLASSLTMRRQPLGVVLYGQPGIGKSHLSDMILHYWASLLERPTGTEYRFFHSSSEEYFTNYRSYMYAIVLDDVAQHRPDRVQGVDPSLATLIKIFNNMPFSPPQAALDDKGKTPMLADVGIVTTNVIDMNIPHFFSRSFAVMRRLPIHIEPVVKAAYRKAGTLSIDPSKTDGGLYTNYWNFVVREPKCHENMVGTYEVTREFETLSELFEWMRPLMLRHYQNQVSMVEGSATFADVVLCQGCGLPQPICSCVTPLMETQVLTVEDGANESLFSDIDQREPHWNGQRLPRMGDARFVNVRLLLNFCRRIANRHSHEVNQHDVAFYAHVHLPQLMTLGYDDRFIENDFLEFAQQREPVVQEKRSFLLELYLRFSWFRKCVRFLLGNKHVRDLVLRRIDVRLGVRDDSLLDCLKEELNKLFPKDKFAERLLAILSVALVARTMISFFTKSQVLPTVQSSTPVVASGDERANVWVQKERTVTRMDFEDNSAKNLSALAKSLNKSCVVFQCVWSSNGMIYRNESRGIAFPSGLLVNAHAVPRTQFDLTVYQGPVAELAGKVHTFVDPCQLEEWRDRDVLFIRTKALPSTYYSKIAGNFAKPSFDGVFDGFYLIRQADGSLTQLRVSNIRKKWFTQKFDEHEISCYVFCGVPQRPTDKGDCGSPLFVETGYGPAIVGIHSIYDRGSNLVMATLVCSDDLKELQNECVVQPTVVPVAHDVVQSPISYIDFHEVGVVQYHGELVMPRARYKSRVADTEIASQLLGVSQHDFAFAKYSQPLMHRWKPQQKALVEYMSPARGLNEVLLAKCAEVLLQDILLHLPNDELKLIHAYPLDVAINGMPGMAYVDGIKRSTSMGYPYLMPKRKFLTELNDPKWQDGVKFDKEIVDKIEELMDKYRRGQRGHPIFNANLKDEVVTQQRFEAGKTRVFFSCPVDFLCVVRMMFLGFTRVVQRNWEIFHCVIGVNVHSAQWEQVHKILTKHGSDRMIAGDFAGFDKKFSVSFMRWAFWIIKQIALASGNFSQEEQVVMECIEADLVNPTVNWFGMLVTLNGGEVSGHQLTTVFNCFCCVLYIMYAYSTTYEVDSFFEHVTILSLGDDHVVGVSPDKPLFTHTHIKDVLEVAGVGYTMAEKEKPSVPYITMSEVTFLKRKFQYHPGVDGIVGPLEKASIGKMLMAQVVPRDCSKAQALAQAMVSASMESFYHGEEFFQFIESCLQQVESSFELEVHQKQHPRLTWEENRLAFLGRSAAEENCRSQIDQSAASYCSVQKDVLESTLSVELQAKATGAIPEVRIHGRVWLPPDRGHTGRESEQTFGPGNQPLATQTISDGASAPNPERMAPDEGLDNGVNLKQEIVDFMNEESTTQQDVTGQMDMNVNRGIDAGLGEYLNRPVKIVQFAWTIGSPPGLLVAFEPWNLFFSNAAIRRKLENFGFIRCNLHLKFLINASPFYYGSVGAFYEPLHLTGNNRLGTTAGYAPGSQVLISQRKGVYLDPQSVSSAELILPFFHYNDYADLTSASDIVGLGQIQLYQFAGLRSANGVASGNVTINVYAWAENVELSGATAKLTLQAKKDEWATGPISRPASIVQGVAERLRDVPVIGQVAMATSTVAGAIKGVASFFGYTNPPVITDVGGVKPVSFHTLASTEQREPINKLSLTAKAETSVGKYPGDADDDMLALVNFCGRRSFLCGTLWETVHGEDVILFSSSVVPSLFERGGTPSCLFPTPISFASGMFDKWRGDIIFTFRVIKSKYHRGRIAVTFDPLNLYASMPATGVATVYTAILDLDETNEVSVRVPYAQAAPFLLVPLMGTARYWSNAATAPTVQGVPGWDSNGTIQLRVLNPLTAPVSTSDVDILVFVEAGQNYELAQPGTVYPAHSLLTLQSNVTVLGTEADLSQDTYAYVFGEKCPSLRQLLHRQSMAWHTVLIDTLTTARLTEFYIRVQRMPRPRGYTSFGTENVEPTIGVGTKKAFICYNHPLLWVTSCFAGYRGSVNYTFNVNVQPNAYVNVGSVSIFKPSEQGPYLSNEGILKFALVTENHSRAVQFMTGDGEVANGGPGGMVLTNQSTQAGLMANLPYYSRRKFEPWNPYNLYGTSGEGNDDSYVMKWRRNVTANGLSSIVDVACGSGPDFDPVYYINCPPMFELLGMVPAIVG